MEDYSKKSSFVRGRHRVFSWVPVPTGDEDTELDLDSVVQDHGIPKKLLKAHIQFQIKQEAAFLTLPFAFGLVLCYCLSFSIHDGASTIRDLETAISVDLHDNSVFAYSNPGYMAHKDIYDVHSYADVFSWLRLGLKPLLFKKDRLWSELPIGLEDPGWPLMGVDPQERNKYLIYNQLVGGMRLTQLRATSSQCKNLLVANEYAMSCAAAKGTVDINFELQPNHFDILAANMESFYDSDLTRWFLVQEDPDDIDASLKQLELSDWLDNTTVYVSASFLTYNAHYDTLTLTAAHFFFSRSGHIWKKIVHSSFFLDNYNTSWIVIWDILFVLLILRLVVNEALEIFFTYRHHKDSESGWFLKYISFWNLVDWISMGSAVALVVMWVLVCRGTSHMESELLKISHTSELLDRFRVIEIHELLEALIKDFLHAFHEYHMFRGVASIFPMILVLRLFKAFDAQPRLALVTRTLACAMVDVSHFALVFAAIFLTYAIMGMALYGREMEDFTDFPRACNTCFLILMGDFDAPEMFKSGRQMAGLWFWSFFVIMVLLMLNMLLAIIMDTYTDVKGTVGDMETLPEQFANLIRRWQQRRRRERLSLTEIAGKLAEPTKWQAFLGRDQAVHLGLEDMKGIDWENEEILKLDDFLDAVDGLKTPQATRLLRQTAASWHLAHADALSLSEAMVVIDKIYKQQADFIKQFDATPDLRRQRHLATLKPTSVAISLPNFRADELDGNPASNLELQQIPRPDAQYVATAEKTISSGQDQSAGRGGEGRDFSKLEEKIQSLEQGMQTRFGEVNERFTRLETDIAERFARLDNAMVDISLQLKEALQTRQDSEAAVFGHVMRVEEYDKRTTKCPPACHDDPR